MKTMIMMVVMAASALTSVAQAQSNNYAIVTADQMSCQQATTYYEKYKRIYVVANGDAIVPIYGMKPISQYHQTSCIGRNKGRRAYWVETRDNAECTIAMYCN